jgi:hypothetical protein
MSSGGKAVRVLRVIMLLAVTNRSVQEQIEVV